jgi:2-dehydropantoate 2-reductase
MWRFKKGRHQLAIMKTLAPIGVTKSSPRIGIIGSGAIGGFYGLMLARAGFEVNFLLRSEYEAVAAHGLLVESRIYGDLRLRKVNAYRSVDDMPPSDWLLVGTKSTTNAAIAPLIVQAAAPGARILNMQNGLGVEDQLRPLLPSSLHLIGGLCYICALRKCPGVIEHLSLGDVHLGYHSGPAQGPDAQHAILEAGAALFRAASINTQVVPDLTEARWHKLIFNIPFNGLSALLNSGTSTLSADPDSRELILDMMGEVVAGANQCGYALSAALPNQAMSLTLPDYLPSMYLDYAQGRPMELDAIYEAPLAAARAAGCAMPKVEALYQSLRFLDARHIRAQPPQQSAVYQFAGDELAKCGD